MTRTSGTLISVAILISLVFTTGGAWAKKTDEPDVVKRLQNATEVLKEIMAAPDKGIPDKILNDAKCVIIVPSLVKIAIGFGGQHGKGFAVCRTEKGWSAPAPVTVTGGSWGLQFGGQAVDLVMLVMNQKGVDHLLGSKFKIGGEASAAAGPVGRHVDAGTDWKMRAEILTYSRARGIFAGIDLSGSVIEQDKDETAVLYGKVVPFEDVLHGQVPPPDAARPLIATLEKYAPSGNRQG